MRNPRNLITVLLLGTVAVLGPLMGAANATTNSQSLHSAKACLRGTGYVVSAGSHGCVKGQTSVTLAINAVTGPQGPAGPQGPEGAMGAAGPAGPSAVMAQQSPSVNLVFATPITIATLPVKANTDYLISASGVLASNTAKNVEIDCSITSTTSKPYGDTRPWVIDAPVAASDLAAEATLAVGGSNGSVTLSCEQSTPAASTYFSDGEFVLTEVGAVTQF